MPVYERTQWKAWLSPSNQKSELSEPRIDLQSDKAEISVRKDVDDSENPTSEGDYSVGGLPTPLMPAQLGTLKRTILQ